MAVTDRTMHRVERARRHFMELDQAIRDFMDDNPYPTTREVDPERGGFQFRVWIKKELPPNLGLIFGDFVHNLRAALDNLIYESALQKHPNPGSTKWPFCQSREAFDEFGMLKYLEDEAIQALESYQPYHGSMENWQPRYLAVLNNFWNRDKHRTTNPIALTSQFTSVAGYGDRIPQFFGIFGPIHDGKVVGWMPPDQEAMELEPDFPISVAFREHNPVFLFPASAKTLFDLVQEIVASAVWVAK